MAELSRLSAPHTPVIVAALRTPIGRSHPEKGFYRHVRAEDLLLPLLHEIVRRAAVPPALIEDLVLGCAMQHGEQGANLARIAALLAGLPASVAGTTVNRWCGSSLEALHIAAHAIIAGDKDVQLVAGVEHMHHVPAEKSLDIHPALYARTSQAALSMGMTAEFLAQQYKVTRAEQDAYALESHARACAAYESGAFAAELLPINGHNEAGQSFVADRDQCVRHDTTATALAELKPVFQPHGGTVTAGNSSPRNDGAAAMLVMSLARAAELGLKPLAAVRATAVIGVEPALMGTGPIAVLPKVLKRANLPLEAIDLFELNEAFAVQAIVCQRELRLDPARVNLHGGALAIGHPLGASGARIMTTLVHAMQRRNARYGVALMCVGLGQGIATLVERFE
jgi:acetyl-CoA acyltransferase